jgi:hypothetical protein
VRKRRAVIVLTVALALGVIATLATGFVYTNKEQQEFNCVTCKTFNEYGWPFPWRTDLPSQYLDDYHGPYTYNENGVSAWDFMLDLVAWVLLFVASLIILYVTSVLVRKRCRPTGSGSFTTRIG